MGFVWALTVFIVCGCRVWLVLLLWVWAGGAFCAKVFKLDVDVYGGGWSLLMRVMGE